MPSRVIAGFEYSSTRNELTILFTTGRIYVYSLVPQAVADGLRVAVSKGAYFNRSIRSQFPFREVERPRPSAGRRPRPLAPRIANERAA